MVQLKKISFYNFFPLFSIISLVLTRLIELDYPTREPQVFNEYLYFNILSPSFYLFLVAYLVPLFISLKLKNRVIRILKIIFSILIVFYIVVSCYIFLIKKQPDFLPNNVDMMLSVLGGVILGVVCADSEKFKLQ